MHRPTKSPLQGHFSERPLLNLSLREANGDEATERPWIATPFIAARDDALMGWVRFKLFHCTYAKDPFWRAWPALSLLV